MTMIIFGALLFALIAYVALVLKNRKFARIWREELKVDISFSEDQVAEGDSLVLYETVENNKAEKIPALSLRFKTSKHIEFPDLPAGNVSDYFYRSDVLSVDGYQKVRRTLKCVCKKRGIYSITEAEFVGFDYFLRHKFIETMIVDTTVVVYPTLLDSRKLLPVFQRNFGEEHTDYPLFEDPFAYIGVREYLPGDSMGRIHWKASARMGEWQVKTSAYMAAEPVLVICNLEAPGVFQDTEAMEENIRITYSLAYYLNQSGIETTVVVNSKQGIHEMGKGRAYLAKLRRAFATIEYDQLSKSSVEMLERQWESGIREKYVFFVSSEGRKETQEMLVKYKEQCAGLCWVATVLGHEDVTRDVIPALKKHVIRWHR